MSKLNCWEHKNCDRTDCPCMLSERFDGFNSGKNGGRICWYVNAIQKVPDKKAKAEQAQKCAECKFFNLVEQEEGSRFTVFV